MATTNVRTGSNPVKKTKSPRKPKPVSAVGGGQGGTLTGMGTGMGR